MTVRACLIANPAAGSGRGARLLPRARSAFASHGITDVRVTRAAGEEGRLVVAALDDGCDTIAVLGGDGTWSKAAAALAGSNASARMAFLSAGTGNDFVKNFPAPSHDFEAMARLVAGAGVERRIDMGRVDGQDFINVAGFGFDVAVLRRVGRTAWAGGAAAYAIAALRELFSYPGLEATLDQATGPTRYLLLAFANGARFGGAFHIAPGARVDDGMLDAVAIGDAAPLTRLSLLARVALGRHVSHPRVNGTRASAFTLTFPQPPQFEVDGELRRASGAMVRVESCPGVLRVLVGDGG